jgi:hypothetical protein
MLARKQDIKFDQRATLEIPKSAHAPRAITGYYEFRQLVKDSYRFHGDWWPTQSWAFVQDGPYKPPYNNAVIDVGQRSIVFHDVPGFSTDRAVGAGSWLNEYDVYFKWQVTHKQAGTVWESPQVHHHMDAEFEPGKEQVSVNHEAAGTRQWEVDLPDRPVD